jgi:hypothetical protein
MIGLLIMFIVFGAFAALSVRYGVDSRVDSSDPRRSDYPVGIS